MSMYSGITQVLPLVPNLDDASPENVIRWANRIAQIIRGLHLSVESPFTHGEVTALGTDALSAAPVPFTLNYVSGADGTVGVVLLEAVPGRLQLIVNLDSGSNLKVWPFSTNEIFQQGVGSLGPGTNHTVGPYGFLWFYARNNTEWYTT